MSDRARLTLFAALAVGALAARPGQAAAAAGQDEWQLSMRAGLGDVDIDSRAPLGLVGGVDIEYGLNDAWAARFSASGGVHPVDARAGDAAPGGLVRTSILLLGMTYTFDVMRLVPYAEAGLGIINFGGAVVSPGSAFSAEMGLGADYLITKRWALGGVGQYLFTPASLFGNAMQLGGTSFYFALAARLSRIF
jgi:hypothetical protein